jgi:nicotinamide riboside kinase
LEQEIEKKANQYLFCDTDFIVLKIWSSYVFGRVSPYILELVEKHRYDYYLLTNNDVKWEPDPLRESTGTAYRKRIFTIYEQELNKLGVSYSIVKGNGVQRFENVLSILETNLK